MLEFVEYPDDEMMMIDLANRLAGSLESALMTHENVSFCVPGGTTPGPLFDVLSGVHMDWDRVTIFLSDERWVPGDSARSNSALLRARLLTGPAGAATLVPMFGASAEPEGSLEALSAGILPHLPISLLLLGMGADMHTASLFPHGDNLAAALAPDAPPLLAMRAPGLQEARVTLSAPVLAGAMETHILIKGAEKRRALEAARSLSPKEAPVAAVLRNAVVHWAP